MDKVRLLTDTDAAIDSCKKDIRTFNKVSLEEVKRRVLLFLQQNSRYSQDLLDHPSWGTYRLNPKSIKAQTTQLSFLPTEDDCPDVAQQKPTKQTGPTLFDNINS